MKLPEGYYVEFGGQFKNLQQARVRLMIVVPVALILIFPAGLRRVRQHPPALLIYSGIPLAVTGGVFALALRGLPFSISAGVGFIALSGVAVLNGLVMIQLFQPIARGRQSVQDSRSRRLVDPPSGAHDGAGRQLRFCAHGVGPRRGSGSSTSAGHRRHRRYLKFHFSDHGIASDALQMGREQTSKTKQQRKKMKS